MGVFVRKICSFCFNETLCQTGFLFGRVLHVKLSFTHVDSVPVLKSSVSNALSKSFCHKILCFVFRYLHSKVDVTAAAIKAGCNLELGTNYYNSSLEAMRQGKLTEHQIRENVKVGGKSRHLWRI